MTCPECGGKTTVADSSRSTDEVLRKRKCLGCGRISYTIEYEVDKDETFRKQWTKHHRSSARYQKKRGNDLCG